jgi:hypothetical protein
MEMGKLISYSYVSLLQDAPLFMEDFTQLNSDLINQYREESAIHSDLLSLYHGIIFNIHNVS